MRSDIAATSHAARRARAGDAWMALAVATLLTLAWTANAWGQLAFLSLPDNDDMMRLAQVRDLLAGQGFNDWTQYRLAPPVGAPMHWSRIPDLLPAAIILSLRPLFGTHLAETVAVIATPGLYFAAYLFLSARIARRIGGASAGPVALIVAAIAYPANSLFLPGRIDHHGLQIVLTLATILALIARPSIRSGAAAGAGIALSLAIGLETAPQVAALLVVTLGLWVARGARERARLIGLGAALGGVTLALLAFARPTLWSSQWCDAFTPASSTGTLAIAGYWLALATATPKLRDRRARLIAGGVLGAAMVVALAMAYPDCLSGPYGRMDPLVRHAFIDNVIEARGLLAQPLLATAIPSAGLMIVATIALFCLMRRRPLRLALIAPIGAALLISDLVLLAQVRGAYLGSALAAPLLAQMIVAARGRGNPLLLAGAWAASAGMLWLIVPERVSRLTAPRAAAAKAVSQACNSGDVWRQIDAYPAGIVIAPMDRAAYIIANTRHATLAASYHRNNAGNRAMYDFFLAAPARARAIAAQWHARYVVLCPGDFGELDIATAHSGSLGAALLAGRDPRWIERLPLRDTGLRFYRIK